MIEIFTPWPFYSWIRNRFSIIILPKSIKYVPLVELIIFKRLFVSSAIDFLPNFECEAISSLIAKHLFQSFTNCPIK